MRKTEKAIAEYVKIDENFKKKAKIYIVLKKSIIKDKKEIK